MCFDFGSHFVEFVFIRYLFTIHHLLRIFLCLVQLLVDRVTEILNGPLGIKYLLAQLSYLSHRVRFELPCFACMDVNSLNDGAHAIINDFWHILPLGWVDFKHGIRVLLDRWMGLRSGVLDVNTTGDGPVNSINC